MPKSFRTAHTSSRDIRSLLNHPVIDIDLHTIEFGPEFEDYIEKYGGSCTVDRYRRGIKVQRDVWYDLSLTERANRRVMRPPWWPIPTKNTLDLATVSLPKLLHERLPEFGTDYAILFPNVAIYAICVGDEDMRRALVRACNHYHADIYSPFRDRLEPVAAIPMHTPSEACDELQFAVGQLGMKVALIPGSVRRPIATLEAKYPAASHPDLVRYTQWVDTFGMDSEFDYDPFWEKAVTLGVPLTTHAGGMGWHGRASISNFMFNHIGHFSAGSEALARSLLFSGVTHRFPNLRVGFLEGGSAWGASLLAEAIGHWEKRNRLDVHEYDPDGVDMSVLMALHRTHGSPAVSHALRDMKEIPLTPICIISNSRTQRSEDLDEFRNLEVNTASEIADRFVPNFYFGCEADDATVSFGFDTRIHQTHLPLRACWASDAGHWDVPDMRFNLSETMQLVERGVISFEQLSDLVFGHARTVMTEANPDFFVGTAVESAVPPGECLGLRAKG